MEHTDVLTMLIGMADDLDTKVIPYCDSQEKYFWAEEAGKALDILCNLYAIIR